MSTCWGFLRLMFFRCDQANVFVPVRLHYGTDIYSRTVRSSMTKPVSWTGVSLFSMTLVIFAFFMYFQGTANVFSPQAKCHTLSNTHVSVNPGCIPSFPHPHMWFPRVITSRQFMWVYSNFTEVSCTQGKHQNYLQASGKTENSVQFKEIFKISAEAFCSSQLDLSQKTAENLIFLLVPFKIYIYTSTANSLFWSLSTEYKEKIRTIWDVLMKGLVKTCW